MTTRNEDVIRLRTTGMRYADIGRQLGISRERARQLAAPESPKPSTKKPRPTFEVMLTLSEAASALGIHQNTLRKWGQKGVIKVYRVGARGDRRFRLADIDKLIIPQPQPE
jgi:excisionase family DNA binding protein